MMQPASLSPVRGRQWAGCRLTTANRVSTDSLDIGGAGHRARLSKLATALCGPALDARLAHALL